MRALAACGAQIPRLTFSTWLTRIVINAAPTARRGKVAHLEASPDEILDTHPDHLPCGAVDMRPDPEQTFATIEGDAFLGEHVRQLTPAST